ncbi:hypothetical protein JCM10296v2_006491 [Rhodotorula toruloides]
MLLPSDPLSADPPPSLALVSREPRTADLSLTERIERLEASYGITLSRLEAFEQTIPSRLDALKQALQHAVEQQRRVADRPSQLVEELVAQITEPLKRLEERISALCEDVAAPKKDIAVTREQASTLKAGVDAIASIVMPVHSWLTGKSPAGDTVRLKKRVESLTKAQKDANSKQRMILHLVDDDSARTLHAAALAYHAGESGATRTVPSSSLAALPRTTLRRRLGEKAEVSEAKQDWEELVQTATRLRDGWVKRETRKGQLPSALLMQDRLVAHIAILHIMDLLRSDNDLRSFFQKHGVDTWALMLWTAARQIAKNRPFANSPSSQTSAGTSWHSSVQTAAAVFRPFLSEFEGAAPEGTTPLKTLRRIGELGAIKVTAIHAPAQLAFAWEGTLEPAKEEGLEEQLRTIFGEARALWKSWVEAPAVLA